jgi:hypothetical protein
MISLLPNMRNTQPRKNRIEATPPTRALSAKDWEDHRYLSTLQSISPEAQKLRGGSEKAHVVRNHMRHNAIILSPRYLRKLLCLAADQVRGVVPHRDRRLMLLRP